MNWQPFLEEAQLPAIQLEPGGRIVWASSSLQAHCGQLEGRPWPEICLDGQLPGPLRLRTGDGWRDFLARALEPPHLYLLDDRTEEKRALERLASLSHCAANLVMRGSLAETLESLCQKVVQTTTAEACSIVLLDQAEGRPQLVAAAGLPPAHRPQVARAMAEPSLGLPTHQALRTGELAQITHQELREKVAGSPLAPIVEAMTWKRMVSAPFHGAAGALNALYLTPSLVPQAELTFLQTLADVAGATVRNRQLAEQLQERTIDQERSRLTWDLHDSAVQTMASIRMGLETLDLRLLPDQAEARQALQFCSTQLQQAGHELRCLLANLDPSSIIHSGLIASLEREIQFLKTLHPTHLSFSHEGEPDLPEMAQTQLFRVIQEALRNALRHAAAAEICLTIEAHGSDCLIQVQDDGRGTPTFDKAGHFGLAAMSDRLALIGGQLQIVSPRPELGHGTRLCIRLPRK